MITAAFIESYSGLYPLTGALTLHRKEATASSDGFNATTVNQPRCRKLDVSLDRVLMIGGNIQSTWAMFEIWNDGQTMPKMDDKLVEGSGVAWRVRSKGEKLMNELHSFICEKMQS